MLRFPSKANQELIQRLNRIAVLRLIREMGPISRADLSKRLQLSPSTITNLTGFLLDRLFIKEIGPGISHSGRRPILLEFNPSGGLLAGVAIGLNDICVMATDLNGNVLEEQIVVSDTRDPGEVLERTRGALKGILKVIQRGSIPLYGIGVAIPGVVRDNTVTFSANLGWNHVDVSVGMDYQEEYPLYVENNARAKALGEFWFGAGRDVSSFVCLEIGHGVAAGFILDGRLYRGSNGTAGEIGHATVDPNGQRCSCGNIGCLQTKVCVPAILARAREGLKKHPTSVLTRVPIDAVSIEEVFDAAVQGDELAKEIFDDVSRFLGAAVGHVISAYDPEKICLTGEVIEASDVLFERVKEMENRQIFERTSNIQICKAERVSQAKAVGAAALAFHNLLSTPDLHSLRGDI